LKSTPASAAPAQASAPETSLPPLQAPSFLNYVGVFLTMDCNLGCSYCINDPEQADRRRELFGRERFALSPDEWIRGLSRLPHRDDLPLTLQGGEPTMYARARGLGELLAGIPHRCDLLTNLVLSPEAFARCLAGQAERLQRDAPYPSIRVSWHPDEMQRVWGEGAFLRLVERCEALAELGFRVTGDKRTSDVGIYMVDVPGHEVTGEMEAIAAGRVPFERKEFLGMHEGVLHGTYRYPFSTNLVSAGIHPRPLSCECRTTELLLDPMGFAWPCHLYLYETWERGGPRAEFLKLRANDFRFTDLGAELLFERHRPVGHLLDPRFTIDSVNRFHPCSEYGRCIGCDTKVKNNRFQSLYDENVAHTSVEITNVAMPPEVQALAEAEASSRQERVR